MAGDQERAVVPGLGREGVAGERAGPVEVAGLERGGGGRGQLVGGARAVLVEEGADLGLGQRADELGGDRAVLEQLDRGDAADALGPGDGLVLVGVELHELDPAGVLGGELLEDRAEHAAGPAPRRPEVDQDGDGARAGHDVAGERGVGGLGEAGHAGTIAPRGGARHATASRAG